ncbi:hypothetical protein Tco_0449136 [Tanacetum coccineum]
MESLNSNSQEREMHQLQQMQDKAKEKCMESFRLLHSHLKVFSIKGGFERACVALLNQDNQTFTESLLLNLVQTKDHNDSLIAQINSKTVENADLKAQIQEKVFANVALKNELRKLKGNSVDTKFAKPSILGKPVLQPPRNQSVVRQPNAFKSERPNFSKPRFASQVDVNNVLSKPVTQHYLPKGRESAFAKPNHMIASSSSRNSSKNMSRFSSNDMVHNYYLEEAKKKTQERDRKSTTSVMPSAKSQNTTKSCKSKPRSNNQTSRVLPTSKSSCPTTTVMPKADHSRNSSPFSDFKHFVCSTCQKIFNTAGLKWVPTGTTFTSSTTKVDGELPNGSNDCITNPYKCDQTLNVSAGTLNLSADQHPCFMIMASVDNTSGPVLQRKERCTFQCALSSKEEKSSYQYTLEILSRKILLKLNLSDHRLFEDGGGVKEFQRSFRHSDTERLSRSDEVLKLKNFKKDATLKLFKSTNQMTTSSANNSVFRGFFEKQKLTGPNFIDWYRQLRIVLSIKDKLNYLEQPLPPAPVAPAGQHVALEILAAHTAWVKGSKEIVGLMLMTIKPEIQRNLENLHANDMLKELKTLFAQQAEQELLQTTRDFHSCKQEEGHSVSSYVLKMKGYIDNLERLRHPVTLDLL